MIFSLRRLGQITKICGRTALLEILARQDDIRDGIQDIKVGLDADRAERRKIGISMPSHFPEQACRLTEGL